KMSGTHVPAGPNGFGRAPVLRSGPTDARLIDGGFSYPEGRGCPCKSGRHDLSPGRHLSLLGVVKG
ncbi:MAG: hypothetical protein ACK5AT_08910, partial [Bradyrhizobium sp.]